MGKIPHLSLKVHLNSCARLNFFLIHGSAVMIKFKFPTQKIKKHFFSFRRPTFLSLHAEYAK